MKKIKFDNQLPDDFYWFNEPPEYHFDQGLIIKTEPETDFWQRTHYGFQKDSGHCLLTDIEGDFSFSVQVEYKPEAVYDQVGLMVRIDEENWIKISAEYEDEQISKLGSVVTNLGYSDWATEDISSEITFMWYRVKKKNNNFFIENSWDGENWSQMRMTHLHQKVDELAVGIYACSPKESSFEAKIKDILIDQ